MIYDCNLNRILTSVNPRTVPVDSLELYQGPLCMPHTSEGLERLVSGNVHSEWVESTLATRGLRCRSALKAITCYYHRPFAIHT